MKRDVCKVIISIDLNDKTIASYQPNVSPRRFHLKLQSNEMNFETVQPSIISKTHIAIRSFIFFNFVHPYLLLYFSAVLLKCSVNVLSG